MKEEMTGTNCNVEKEEEDDMTDCDDGDDEDAILEEMDKKTTLVVVAAPPAKQEEDEPVLEEEADMETESTPSGEADPPFAWWNCLVCTEILVRPAKLFCCGQHVVCGPCFQRHLDEVGRYCPLCLKRIGTWRIRQQTE